MTRPRTIGIDLGTTNSVVATIDEGGAPRIIANRFGDATTPSVVSFAAAPVDGGQPIVGAPARRRAIDDPRNTFFGVKRLIGRRYDDPELQELARTLPYEVDAAPNGDAVVMAHGAPLSPPEVSALVLAELRAIAEAHFGGEVDGAILTVPAHFDDQQRQATMDAAAIAGLRVRRLLNEPTAAALGYGAHREGYRRLAVCDLGGGTFDVSIVNVEDGIIEVISTQGDLFLGGDDVDRAVVAELAAEIEARHGVSVLNEPVALQRLREAAQEAKHTLSGALSADLELRYLATLPSGAPLDHRRTVRREELAAWVAPVLARLEAPCREAVARCGLRPRDIEAVVLVGGMTRMPAVQEAIGAIFERPPVKVVNPDEIVSIGAATQCAILDGLIEGVVLLDVTSRALGIQPEGGRYQEVVPQSATIPTRGRKIVATRRDGQRELRFDVFEGESPDPRANRHLGRFVCAELPDAPAGEVLVLVEFTVDVDGLLRVSATELASGEPPELRLVATAGLTRAEVTRLAQGRGRAGGDRSRD